MISAAEAERDLIYFTFNDKNTVDILNTFTKIINDNKLDVGQLYKLLNEYAEEIRPLKETQIKMFDLHQFFKTKFHT